MSKNVDLLAALQRSINEAKAPGDDHESADVAASAHVPTTADVKAAYCVAGMYAGNYATAYLEGLKRFGPEFDAWLAGIPASVPTDQEPAPTLVDAPGADSEALAALLGLHRRPAEALTVFGEAWMVCGCGERIDIPVRDGRVSQREMHELHETHTADAILGSSWLADHDRQTAERVWAEGHRAGFYGMSPDGGANPYSEEARRG